MRIAITGGYGFIGAAVAKALRNEGHSVKATDIAGADARHIRNVLIPDDCAHICRGADVVIHSAAIHNAATISADPTDMVGLNIDGTANMLTAAVSEGAQRFIYLSTGKIYGDASYRPSRESDLPRPREQYALTKLAGEYYLENFSRKHGLECLSIRPFSVYGPGQDLHTGYIGMLIESLLNGTPTQLPGAGDFLRDFVHISDVARLCAVAATAPLPPFSVLNSGSGQATRLDDLVRITQDLSEERIQTSFRKPGAGTLTRSCGDMATAFELFGYQPMIDLQTGLPETLEWFQSRIPAQRAAGG
ncbi:MAG: NAD-dependent epimerase/dehydratase family protein [Gammaproteobacteria bacterium]|jgi:nucleoside-diphosphate-sugar epimerase|nr:NAD-dependent epimerase/dehydratase family protein [Gammaproteobacteria bacterium]